MRIFLSFILILGFSTGLFAQIESGFTIGSGITNLKAKHTAIEDSINTQSYSGAIGFTVGGYLQYSLPVDYLSLKGSLLLTQKGAMLNRHYKNHLGQTLSIAKIREEAYYLELPIVLQSTITPWVSVSAGFYNAFALGFNLGNFANSTGRYFQGIPAYDIGYLAGVEFKVNRFSLGTTYSGGAWWAVRRDKNNATNSYKISNRTLLVTMSYAIQN